MTRQRGGYPLLSNRAGLPAVPPSSAGGRSLVPIILPAFSAANLWASVLLFAAGLAFASLAPSRTAAPRAPGVLPTGPAEVGSVAGGIGKDERGGVGSRFGSRPGLPW